MGSTPISSTNHFNNLQFSLSLREAKDVLDEVYEKMLKEKEEDDDDDDAVADHYELIDAFVQSLAGSYDHGFQLDASFVLSTLHDFLRDYHGTELADLDANLIDEYLLDYFPRKVTAEEETVDRVPTILNFFLQFAGENAFLKNQGRLIHTVDSLRETFKQAARDPRNFGPAKSFTTAMLKAGVDPTDQKQAHAFMLEYNLNMLAGRTVGGISPPPSKIKPALAKPKPEAARNGPCPCGSGRKYKRCCGKA